MRLAKGHRVVGETRPQVCVPRNSATTCTKASCLAHLPCLSKFSGLDQDKNPRSKCHLEPQLTDCHIGAHSFFQLSDPITLIGKASQPALAQILHRQHSTTILTSLKLAQLPHTPRHGWCGRNIHLHSSHQSMPTNIAEKVFINF